jgi:hypothetical protein
VCVLWVRSYWMNDWLGASVGGSQRWPFVVGVGALSSGGRLNVTLNRVTWDRVTPQPADMPTGVHWSADPAVAPSRGRPSWTQFDWHGMSLRRQYPIPPRPRGGGGRVQQVAPGQPGMILRYAVLSFPDWALAAFVSLPALARVGVWLRRRRRERRGENACASCGYDLRASPERCPECGKPVPVVQPTSSQGAPTQAIPRGSGG